MNNQEIVKVIKIFYRLGSHSVTCEFPVTGKYLDLMVFESQLVTGLSLP